MKRLFLFHLSLFASVNEPLRLELLTGYRNDTIRLHEKEYDNIQFWENELALRLISRDIVFYARGGYGAFGNGTNSWALDGVAHVGYAANLTPDRTYKAIVIPLVGFSGHYEQLNPDYYQQTLYGPYLGGAIKVEPGNQLLFEVGYAYNWLHIKLEETRGWGNYGHSGWAQMDFEVGKSWHLGLFGQIDYVYSAVLHWVAVSGMFVVSRQL